MTLQNYRQRAARPVTALAMALVTTLVLAACSRSDAEPGADQAVVVRPSATAAPASAGPVRPVDAVKLVVNEPGLQRVTAADLREAGFDPDRADAARLALTLAGQPVTLAVEGSGDALALTFYGEPRASRYGRDAIYRLAWGDQAGADAGRTIAPAGGEPATTFTDRQTLEEATTYLSQLPAGSDHWLWQSLFAPADFDAPFDLPGWAGGDVDLAVALWANTQDPAVAPDHRAVLSVNGQQVAEAAWDGQGMRTITATVPADIVQAAGNTFSLSAPGDTGAAVEMLYLDRIDLAYARQLALTPGQQFLFSVGAGAPVAIQGAASDQMLLWDVTDPGAAQPLNGAQADGEGLRFQDDAVEGVRRYALASEDTLLTPRAILPDNGVDLRQNAEGADYIAITHPDFAAALQPLIDFRRGQGLRVTVAAIPDVYDTFSGGMVDPAAMRDYMRYARDNWPAPAPRFLLLVGDASYDYQGFLADGTPDLVPTYLLQTHFVGETASDNWFVSLDDEEPA